MTEPDPLLALFTRYNPAVWPVQVVAPLVALVGLALIAFRPSRLTDRLVAAFMAALWLLVGVVFQGVFVRELDAALAVVYAVAFVAQGLLLLAFGVSGDRLAFGFPDARRSTLAVAVLVYALLVYPLIGVALGHGYPQAPLFGAAPCPTTIFTFGLFLLVRAPLPRVLLVVPLFWALVATPAAVGRGVLEDVAMLLVALVVTAVVLVDSRGALHGAPRSKTLSGGVRP